MSPELFMRARRLLGSAGMLAALSGMLPDSFDALEEWQL
jgi:hypothetical protein